MTDAAANTAPSVKRPKQGRSPAYPALSLKAALAKAKALYDTEGKYAVPMPSAFAAWGFGAKSSGGRETRAALRYYGLVTIEGDGELGKVKLTDDALRVLLDQREDQTEKKSIIRRLALVPSIHKKLVDKFPEGLKSDPTVEHFLVFEEKYNETAARDLLKEFKETADFAELFQPHNGLDKEREKDEDSLPPDDVVAEVGDLIQAVLNGGAQFKEPKRVRAVQDFDGKPFVFVDGETTGVPMENVEVVQKGKQESGKTNTPPPLPVLPLERGWHEERLIDDGGDEIFIRYEGEPSAERYEFIRDYLSFKIDRLNRAAKKGGAA